ncbi:hypothetical protein [Nonomuraea sp. NPDC049709]|uniref:hypothetical protein n=1 Tax=Nonomuraea sp. NPDC049709 TaxID=3154736 RepID=UPI00343307CA
MSCVLGGNDVTRVGPDAGKPQVSLAQSVANLRRLRRIGGAAGGRVGMTPVPVLEERVTASPTFHYSQVTWSNSDVVALYERLR